MKHTAKVILVGNSGVGKSCWLQSAYHQCTNTVDYTTVGAQFQTILWKGHRLNFWDTAGQERYASVVDIFFRQADVVLLFYSVIDSDSKSRLSYWFDKCNQICPQATVIIIGNKIDMADHLLAEVKLSDSTVHYLTTIYNLDSINVVLDHIISGLKDNNSLDSINIFNPNESNSKYSMYCCK